MDLKDYIKKDENQNGEESLPVITRKKREKVTQDVKKNQEKPEIPEMTDDECIQFYVDISNMAYMAINDELRPLTVDEVMPVKTAAGNVIRTLMKYLGDYRIYLDAAVVTGFTIGIYKQRAAELPYKEKKKEKDKKEVIIETETS